MHDRQYGGDAHGAYPPAAMWLGTRKLDEPHRLARQHVLPAQSVAKEILNR